MVPDERLWRSRSANAGHKPVPLAENVRIFPALVRQRGGCAELILCSDAGRTFGDQRSGIFSMRHILLIEDDDRYRTLLAQILRDAGYALTEASNGRAGVRRFRAEPIDLVITDLIMPEQEGLETIRELRAAQPDLPIFAISGYGTESELYLKMATKFGARRVLTKPFHPAELMQAIKEVLHPSPDLPTPTGA